MARAMYESDYCSSELEQRDLSFLRCLLQAEDVTPRKLTTMAFDITSGLVYLADMKFVHR